MKSADSIDIDCDQSRSFGRPESPLRVGADGHVSALFLRGFGRLHSYVMIKYCSKLRVTVSFNSYAVLKFRLFKKTDTRRKVLVNIMGLFL